MSRQLDAAGILAFCRTGAVPVNVRVAEAIKAHRKACAGEDRDLVALVLRAIVLARTGTRKDYGRQLDYLAPLPLAAWEGRHYPAAQTRKETLATIYRQVSALQ